MKRYKVGNKEYNVAPHREAEFLEKHKDAILVHETYYNKKDEKFYNVAPHRFKEFKVKHPNAVSLFTGKTADPTVGAPTDPNPSAPENPNEVKIEDTDLSSENTSSDLTFKVYNKDNKIVDVTLDQYNKGLGTEYKDGKYFDVTGEIQPKDFGWDWGDENVYEYNKDTNTQILNGENWTEAFNINDKSTWVLQSADYLKNELESAASEGRYPGLKIIPFNKGAFKEDVNNMIVALPDGTQIEVNLNPNSTANYIRGLYSQEESGIFLQSQDERLRIERNKLQQIDEWYKENSDKNFVISGLGKVLGDYDFDHGGSFNVMDWISGKASYYSEKQVVQINEAIAPMGMELIPFTKDLNQDGLHNLFHDVEYNIRGSKYLLKYWGSESYDVADRIASYEKVLENNTQIDHTIKVVYPYGVSTLDDDGIDNDKDGEIDEEGEIGIGYDYDAKEGVVYIDKHGQEVQDNILRDASGNPVPLSDDKIKDINEQLNFLREEQRRGKITQSYNVPETITFDNPLDLQKWFSENLTDADYAKYYRDGELDMYELEREHKEALEKYKQIELTDEQAINGIIEDGSITGHLRVAWEERSASLLDEIEGDSNKKAKIKTELEMGWTLIEEHLGSVLARGLYVEPGTEDVPDKWRTIKFEQLRNLKDKLSPEAFDLLDSMLNDGVGFGDSTLNNWKNAKSYMFTTRWFEDKLKHDVRRSYFQALIDKRGVDLEAEEQVLKIDFKTIMNEMKVYEKKHKVIGEDLFKQLQVNGVGWEFHGEGRDMYVVVDAGDNKKKQQYYQKLANDWLKTGKSRADEFDKLIFSYRERFQEWQNNIVFNSAKGKSLAKEFVFGGWFSGEGDGILAQDWDNAWQSLFHGLPAYLGSEASQRILDNQKLGAAGIETMLTWQEAVDKGEKGEFYLRTMTQQSANLTTAIGGSLLGVPLWATAFGVFGTTAAGENKAASVSRVAMGEKSKIDLLTLEKNKKHLTPQEYRTQRLRLEQSIVYGDLNWWQINSAATLAGIIEGGITWGVGHYLGGGTLGNINKMFKDLGVKGFGQALGATTGHLATRSIPQALQYAFLETGKRMGTEVLEETAIFGATELSNMLTLGNEYNVGGFDDVIVASLMIGGTMGGVSVTGSTAWNQFTTRNLRAEVKASINDINLLFEARSKMDPTDKIGLEANQDAIARILESMGVTQTNMQIQAMVAGPKGIRALVKDAINLQVLYNKAGVKPGMSETQIKNKIENYKKTLSKSEAKAFQVQLETSMNSRNRILTEVNDRIDNEENILPSKDKGDVKEKGKSLVEELYGARGLEIGEKLSKKKGWDKKSNREKLIDIHREVQKTFRNSIINQAKSSSKIKKLVEEHVYGKGGFKGAQKKGRKNRKRKEEDEAYKNYAFNWGMHIAGITIDASQGAKNIKKILEQNNIKELSDLNLIDASVRNEDGTINIKETKAKLKLRLGETSLSPGKFDKIIDDMIKAKTFGLVIDGKYIVINKKGVKEGLANGRLAAGTVYSHEFLHATENVAYKGLDKKTAEEGNELLQMAQGLWRFMRGDKVLRLVHLKVLEDLQRMKGLAFVPPAKGGEVQLSDQSLEFQTEYINKTQDYLAGWANQKVLNYARKKAGSSGMNILRGIVRGDFKFTKPKDSMAYLVDYIDSFSEGKISSKIRRKIKAKTRAGDASIVADEGVRKSRDYSAETEIVNELAAGWTNDKWVEMGADFAIETMMKETILDKLIASKLKVPMSIDDTKEFTRKVYAELTTHVKRFKPEFNDSLFGWINSQIANKAGNVYNREYKIDPEKRTQDIDARTEDGQLIVQVEADVSSEQAFIDKIGLNEDQSIKYSKLRRDLNLTEEMILKVRNAVIKTFGTKLPGVETRQFKAELQKRFRTELKKAIQDTIGSRSDYDQFLQENFDAIFKALPVETLVQIERTVAPENRIFTESRRITKPIEVDKLISEGKLPKGTSRLSGPQLHTKKRSPSPAKVLAFFRGSNMLAELGYEVGSSTLGTRKDKLAMEIGVELAFDATSEILMDPDIQAKRQGILELQGILQAENELAIIAKQIDRDPNIRFSRQVNNNADELSRVLYYSKRGEFLSKIAKGGVFTPQSIRRAYEETFENKIINEDGKSLKTKIVNEIHRLLTPYNNILTEDYVQQGRSITEMMTVEEFVQLTELDANPNLAIAKFLGLPNSMASYFSNPTQKRKYRGYINDIFTERIIQLQETGLTEFQAKEQAVSEAIRFKYFLDNSSDGKPARAMAFDNKNDFVKNLIAKIIPGAHSYVVSTKKDSKTAIIKNKKGDVITEIDLGRDVVQKVTQEMVDGKVTKEEFKTRENVARENWDFVNNIMELGIKLVKESEGKYSNIEIGMLSAGFLGNMKTPLRAAAELRYLPDNISDRNIKNYRYEHGIPAKVIMMHLLDHHLNGNTIDLDLLKKNYVVGVVSHKMDANFGRAFGDRMQFGYKIGDSPLKRWFNELTVKGDLHTLIDLKTNKIVGEGHAKMSDMILETKEQYDQRVVIEEAHNQKNITIRKSRADRGMAVFDFDDTMAFTKSGVRGRVPNSDGKPKPKKKVIFLAGGAGSGKSNVVKKLGLEEQGFKIVNQDISLEWLKKNHGLPENMNDLNKEQKSLLGKLGHQARGIAKRKMMKFQGKGDGVVVDGTGASLKQMQKLVAEFEAKGYDVGMIFVETSMDVALKRNAARKERSLLDFIVKKNHEAVMGNKGAFKGIFGERFMEINTDNLSFEDQMPAELVDKVNNFTTSYEKIRLNAEEFAKRGQEILDRGGEFDFSEFNDVVDGTPGPLIQKALKLAKEHGTKDIFILTARPAESAQAIHEFLKSQELNIPIENIVGLGDSKANSKAEWMLSKFAEGYNNMYFVDDAIQNVEAVQTALEQLDIKSKVVQVRMSRDVDGDFNNILEQVKGMDSKKVVNKYEAKALGKGKNIFERIKRQDLFFIPPSAEDFKGLIYHFLGKGKEGDAHMKWFKENLLDPFAKGIRNLNTTLQTMTDEYTALKKKFNTVDLRKEVLNGKFTNDVAIRVYLWNKAGYNIPGLNQKDLSDLVYLVETTPDLLGFAEGLSVISRQDVYVKPSQTWMVETIGSELNSLTKGGIRQKLLAEWIEQKNIIFNENNLNKIEALYGSDFREALENILYRMEHGTNRLTGKDGPVNTMLNWINGSVGAVMFLNIRSAMLQTISTVNFLNFEDNNIFTAAKAFANPKQFWSDFAMIFNSDQLKQRRGGLQMDVSASELTNQFKESGYNPRTLIKYMLEKGFLPTRIADSFAIAFGGASFFRNRFNMYKKQGMSDVKAKEQAWLDFQEIAEETQQSSRPDLISQQQAGPLGRLILAWQNTPMQMTRLTKKALSDLINGRGSVKGNIAKILYYGAIQNLIFGALQSGLAMLMWGDDEEAIKEREKRVLNGALDTILRGTGIYGSAISTVKNTYLQWQKQREKKYGRREDYKIMQELINLSPPIGTKFRKIMGAIKTEQYNQGVSKEIGFRIENPTLSIVANLVEAATNAPVARLLNKANNLEEAITGNHELWQRLALGLGWSRWDVGVRDEELEEAKGKARVQRKIDKKIIKEKEKEEEIKELEKQGYKDIQCSGIRSNGERCKLKNFTKAKTWKCQHHAAFKDGMDRDGDGLKEYLCTATTSSGKRCKNKTENKNKKCYAHQ